MYGSGHPGDLSAVAAANQGYARETSAIATAINTDAESLSQPAGGRARAWSEIV